MGSGTTARDLKILGTADEATPDRIDGTEEITIDISDADGLQDVVDAINASNATVSASVINDGSAYNPYHLSIVSQNSGSSGRVIVDVGDSELRFSTVQRGQDAIMRFGSSEPGSSPLVLTSSTNSFANIVDGMNLTVVAPSETAVTVSVSRDTSTIVSQVSSFVETFNSIQGAIDNYSSYDPDSEERGILQGEGTLLRIETLLTRQLFRRLNGISGTITRFSQLGVKFKSNGELEFDEETFHNQLSENLPSVKAFFATEDDGFAGEFEELIDRITDPYESILSAKSEGIDKRIDLFNDRIESMAELLVQKETRLVLQFTQMEMAIGQLQSQSSFLNAIQTFKVPKLGGTSQS